MSKFYILIIRDKKNLLSFIQKELVSIISLTLATLSMFFIQPSPSYISYIDFKVLSCLFCLMAVVSGLRKTGIFEITECFLTRFCGTVRSLAYVLILSTFFISMAITNDVALITFIPFSLLLLKKVENQRSRIIIITLQTIAANIGSSLTPVGNPQNLYLFSFYKMTVNLFFTATFPIVLAGGIFLILAILSIKNEKIQPIMNEANFTCNIRFIALYVLLFIISVLAVFHVFDYRIVLITLIVVIMLVDRHIFSQIDYSLLFTFLCFFIFIGNVQKIESIKTIVSSIVQSNVILSAAIVSQFISNVPAAILLSRFTNNSTALLQGVSIGGMGSIIASLASVISYKFFLHNYPHENRMYIRIFSFWNILFFLGLFSITLVCK